MQTMKILHENGTFWNAENNCWTVARSAATEYTNCDDLPRTIGDLEFDEDNDGYYRGDALDQVASIF